MTHIQGVNQALSKKNESQLPPQSFPAATALGGTGQSLWGKHLGGISGAGVE